MTEKRKRPFVDWLRWSRKIVLYLVYSMGALIFGFLERLDALLAGKPLQRKGPSRRNPLRLTLTLASGNDDPDALLPFVPLFIPENTWLKLNADRVCRELATGKGIIRLSERARGCPEGLYRVSGLVVMASRRKIIPVLEEMLKCGGNFAIRSLLLVRRGASYRNAKDLLVRMATGRRDIAVATLRGSDAVVGKSVRSLESLLDGAVSYQHWMVAVEGEKISSCAGRLAVSPDVTCPFSVYACVHLPGREIIPVFLFHEENDRTKMEDAVMLFVRTADDLN